jgi:energy-coupling factor transporter ATP-binding protein EcfA2
VGLDRPGRETLLELLAEAAVAGAALIVATHQDDYLGMATRCIALHDGVVVYDGPATPEAVDEVLGT